MRRNQVAFTVLALLAAGAVSAQAQVTEPAAEIGQRIVVANHSVTPVRVFLEDAAGQRHELGRVDRGRTAVFAASEELSTAGDFRVVVRPSAYTQFSADQVSVRTETLGPENDQTVILWLERDLGRSKVEVRRS